MPTAKPMPIAAQTTRAVPPAQAENPSTTKVIDIAALMRSVDGDGSRTACENRSRELIQMLEAFVSPSTWKRAGGQGSMVYFASNHTLVVNNTAPVVQDVEKWIEKMHLAAPSELMISVMIFRCEKGMMEKLGFVKTSKGPQFFSPVERSKMMDQFKAERSFSILSAPHMVVRENQTGFFQTGGLVALPSLQPCTPTACPDDHCTAAPCSKMVPIGVTLRVTPRVSADRKFTHIRFESQTSNVAPLNRVTCEQPMAVQPVAYNVQESSATVVVPCGQTAVVPMGTERVAEKIETKIPMLESLPQLTVLFRTTATTTKEYETFALVTANVLGQAETPHPHPIQLSAHHTASMQERKPNAKVTAYQKAVAEGRMDDARRFALEALLADPTCFTK